MALDELFGSPREEVWKQLCAEMRADFIDGGFWKGDKVELLVDDAWLITLDVFSVPRGKRRKKYTRLRVPFVSLDDFRFLIYRKGLFTGMGKMLGTQDVEVGDPGFDEEFVIQGNNVAKLKVLFARESIQQLLQYQPEVRFEVRDNLGRFWETLPASVDVLYFQVEGVMTDLNLLKGLFYLFMETLQELYRMGTVSKMDPGVKL
ncbi:MAG TPA: DUF3137 domain-containing protein [Thermoanaerobaculia bacterium]|nr:DUF3137 domain-containing protein [Thermoanaerobaculia bacterium]